MDTQKLLFNFIVNIIPIIAVLYIVMGAIVFKVRGENRTNFFTLLMIAAAIYSFGYFLELNSIDYKTMIVVRNFEFFGAVFIPSLGILFVAEIVKIKIANWAKALLLLVSGTLWVTFITNPWHHLIYEKVQITQLSGFGFVVTTKGPSFYTMLFFSSFFIIFSSILIFKAYKKSKSLLAQSNRTKSLRFLLISFQMPWLAILFVILGFDKYIDPVPGTLM
ncbi:MAG: histidine kinase N-terminal 7TM domain-containing protein, partial [archaeon]